MSLKQQFRLHYGEGKIKEKDFRLFRLGYEYGLEEAAKVAEAYPSDLTGSDYMGEDSTKTCGGGHDWCYDCARETHQEIANAIRALSERGES